MVGRIIPVAFAALYALSGSVGPILGQNLGAQRHDRLRVVVVYVLCILLVLALASHLLADAFGAQGVFLQPIAGLLTRKTQRTARVCAITDRRELCRGSLGFVHYSTALNWGSATLGIVPFIWLGTHF